MGAISRNDRWTQGKSGQWYGQMPALGDLDEDWHQVGYGPLGHYGRHARLGGIPEAESPYFVSGRRAWRREMANVRV